MKPVLYRYRDSESVIKAMDGYTPCEGWEPLYDQAAIDAAVAAERERCAKVCDAIAEDKWALYKGRKPYTGKEPGRASDVVLGQSDGADQCADAIREGE